MFNLFLHKYSIFHKSSLWGSIVPAETLNLHVFYILLFFLSSSLSPSTRAECMNHYLLEKSGFFFKSLGPEPLYINCCLLYYVQC